MTGLHRRTQARQSGNVARIPQRLRFDAQTVAAGDGPKWNLLFLAETTRFRPDFPGGRIDISREFLDGMLANWHRQGKPQLKLDYFHRGNSDDNLPREEKVASGWLKDLRLTPLGLEGLVEWTDEAKRRILANELKCLSPEFAVDGYDTTTGKRQGPTLYGAALLNDPFLFDLPPIAASAQPNKENPMNFLQRLCAALGLPADSDENAVLEGLEDRLTKPTPPPGDEKTMSALVKDALALALEPVRADVVKLKAENDTLRAAAKAAAEVKLEADIKSVRRLALSRGYQADRIEGLEKMARTHGVAFVSEMLEGLPPSPMLREIGHGDGGSDGADTPESATTKLRSLAAEIAEKERLTLGAARERAFVRHPALAKLASALKSPHN